MSNSARPPLSLHGALPILGILGEFPKDGMLRRLRQEVTNWNKADPAHPVQPCLHMVAVVAQGESGTSGHYRSIMRDTTVKEVHSWAKEADRKSTRLNSSH